MLHHLGIILSNQNNKQTIARVRKFLQKRINERSELLNLKNKIEVKEEGPESKTFVPKFSYVEVKKDKTGETEIMMAEDFDLEEDDMLDEFDE
jgi:hypothetical protein